MDTKDMDTGNILYVSKLNIDRDTDNFLEVASISNYPMLVKNIYDEDGNLCRIIDVETINGKTRTIPDTLAVILMYTLDKGYRYVAISDRFEKSSALHDYSTEWDSRRYDAIDFIAGNVLEKAGFHPVRETSDGKPFYEYEIPAGIFSPTEEDVKEFRNTKMLSKEESFGWWLGRKTEPLINAKNMEAYELLRTSVPDGFADDEKIRKFVNERITYSYRDVTNHCIDVMENNGWVEFGEFKKL